ncbi:hypothetical protein CEK25_004355 [Fusarium fujikuroi]|nr:hypothetical protein CEK25_004355 [Fusarium fujikuroi]
MLKWWTCQAPENLRVVRNKRNAIGPLGQGLLSSMEEKPQDPEKINYSSIAMPRFGHDIAHVEKQTANLRGLKMDDLDIDIANCNVRRRCARVEKLKVRSLELKNHAIAQDFINFSWLAKDVLEIGGHDSFVSSN